MQVSITVQHTCIHTVFEIHVSFKANQTFGLTGLEIS